jgi:hypothetical protein
MERRRHYTEEEKEVLWGQIWDESRSELWRGGFVVEKGTSRGIKVFQRMKIVDCPSHQYIISKFHACCEARGETLV